MIELKPYIIYSGKFYSIGDYAIYIHEDVHKTDDGLDFRVVEIIRYDKVDKNNALDRKLFRISANKNLCLGNGAYKSFNEVIDYIYTRNKLNFIEKKYTIKDKTA